MNLSKRLNAVASMVTKGNLAADVGTDHGYVAIYLVEKGICPCTYAMDINDGPLERAKEHIESASLMDSVTIIKSDGMKGLKGKKVDTAIVAGMGGMLICKILEESPVLDTLKEMILSPHSDVDKVRRTVMEKGFVITDEVMVEDYGKYYNVIKAEKCIMSESEYSDFDIQYSKKLFENKDEIFYGYLLDLKDKYNRIITLLNNNDEGVSQRNYELRKKLKECEKAIDKWNAS